MGLCAVVRKKQEDIDPLPQLIMIHVNDTDYSNCEVKCLNDIEHRLLIHEKQHFVAVGVAMVVGGTAAASMDVAADKDNVVGVVVLPSSTKDKDMCVCALVAFEGACINAFADGAEQHSNNGNVKSAVGEGGCGGSLAPWGTRIVAIPVNLIVSGNAIVVAIVVIVVVVSQDLVAEGGVKVAIPPLSLSLPTSAVAAALFLLLNVRRSR